MRRAPTHRADDCRSQPPPLHPLAPAAVSRCAQPLYLNMFFVFMVQFLFCLVAGTFMAIAKVNGDICDHHLQLLRVNLNPSNTTIQVGVHHRPRAKGRM